MTEIHDPVRLLTIVEQTPEIALEAARRKPAIFEWIEHDWVRYASVHPETRRISIYAGGAMQPLELHAEPAVHVESSLAAARRGRGNLAPCFIVPERAS
jgi:uncharacterized protein YbcC (UPF0753/DUF2309 family)